VSTLELTSEAARRGGRCLELGIATAVAIVGDIVDGDLFLLVVAGIHDGGMAASRRETGKRRGWGVDDTEGGSMSGSGKKTHDFRTQGRFGLGAFK